MSQHVSLWRIGIEAANLGAHDLSGKAAEKSGGRWNRVGTPMVYCSTSIALATLEAFVKLSSQPLPLRRYLVQITIPPSIWDSATEFKCRSPGSWDSTPAKKTSLDWGTDWAASQSSLLARVPSALVPEDFNVLINPIHADADYLQARVVRSWSPSLVSESGNFNLSVDPQAAPYSATTQIRCCPSKNILYQNTIKQRY